MGIDRIAVPYARVSDRDKQDHAQMLRALVVYCAQRGWPVHSQHFDKVTGDPARRRSLEPPGLRAAIAAVESLRGRGVLVITAADRLVRSPIELLQVLARIQALPGAVASMEDGSDLDTTNDTGELLLFFRGWFSRFELRLIRRRTKLALEDRKAEMAARGSFEVRGKRSKRRGQRIERLGRPDRLGEDQKARISLILANDGPLSAYRIAREVLGDPKLETSVRRYLKKCGEKGNRNAGC